MGRALKEHARVIAIAIWPKFAIMVKDGINLKRMQQVAQQAAAKETKKMENMLKVQLDKGLLTCRYIGTHPQGQKLNAKARVVFEWRVKDLGAATSTLFLAPVLYDLSLVAPHSIKMPYLMAALPKALTEQKNLPFLADETGQVTCRSIALPKDNITEQKLKKGTVEGKDGAFLLLAKVHDKTWICLPEKAKLLTKHLSEEAVTDLPDGTMPILSGEAWRKVYSIAHFQAEVARAKFNNEPVDLAKADQFLESNAMQWNTRPKSVLVRWAVNGEERVDEVPLRSIVKRR